MRSDRFLVLRKIFKNIFLYIFVLTAILSCSAEESSKKDAVEEQLWIDLLNREDLSAFRPPKDRWQFVGDAFLDPQDDRRIAAKPGTGILVGRGGIPNIFTALEHSDVEAHIEFMVSKGSNSGVYFMGRYEIQVFDSWGVEKPQHSDCGGIYQRWDESRQGEAGFDGIPPRVNASRKPGEWQSYDVIFKAPRFDKDGKKVANAVFVKVVHNGVVIHENAEATGPTRAAAFGDEKKLGPLMLQGDHGPVAYRNIRIRPLAGAAIVGAGYIDDELINALMEYDFGGSREALIGIEEEIRNASSAQKQMAGSRLLAVLESGKSSYAAKQFVCRLLQQIGTEESVPVLAGLLTDEKLSHMARFALQQMPYGEVDRVLVEAMGKASDRIKIGIIGSIAQRGSKESVEKIAQYISSDNKELAASAIDALGAIGGQKASEILMKAKVSSALERTRNDALVRSADRMLSEGQSGKALAVYEKMAGEDKDVMVRIAAYSGIVKANKDKAAGMVLSLLEDKNREIRNAAARFVAEMEGVEATRAFAEKIASLGIDSQVMLINCLANRGDTAAAIDVAKAVKSDDKKVRIAAIEALGSIGTASEVKLLAELTTEEPDISRAAEESLARLGSEGVSAKLIEAAKKSPADICVNIIEVFVGRQQKSALPFLLEAANDERSVVRIAAYKALGSLAGEKEVADIVELLLKNEDSGEREQIRLALVSVIKRIENLQEVSETIIECITKAEDDDVRVSLLPVLNQIGNEKALFTARGYLGSRNPDIKKAAIRTLSDWPESSPMQDLLDIAAADSVETNRVLALRGYIKLVSLPSERFNSQTVGMLQKAFELASRAEEKKSVLYVLPEFPCKEALALARKGAEDESIAAEAGTAIKKLEAMSLIAAGSKVSASGGTNVHMLNDQIIPKGPRDGLVSFHWWPRKGTQEWVQYEFGNAKEISGVEVYWFDDTSGGGECRIPRSWEVLYREDGQWKQAEKAGEYGIERDKFNKVTFEPVQMDTLRLQINLQDGWSCGIHELWVE